MIGGIMYKYIQEFEKTFESKHIPSSCSVLEYKLPWLDRNKPNLTQETILLNFHHDKKVHSIRIYNIENVTENCILVLVLHGKIPSHLAWYRSNYIRFKESHFSISRISYHSNQKFLYITRDKFVRYRSFLETLWATLHTARNLQCIAVTNDSSVLSRRQVNMAPLFITFSSSIAFEIDIRKWIATWEKDKKSQH